MEYILIKDNGVIELYHSLRRLLAENDIDPRGVKKDMLPVKTTIGKIIGVIPDTRI